MQPSTREEKAILELIRSSLAAHSDVQRRYWTFDVPEYPGLNRLAWDEATESDPASNALVIDYDPEVWA
jgi:hypothetical protein